MAGIKSVSDSFHSNNDNRAILLTSESTAPVILSPNRIEIDRLDLLYTTKIIEGKLES